jgi:hypothetical protein
MSTLKLFNTQLVELLEDISRVYPNDRHVKTCNFYIKNVLKVNNLVLLTHWYNYITIPYQKEILNGNIDCLLVKDHTSDINGLKPSMSTNTDEIMNIIHLIQQKSSTLSHDNKTSVIKYLQNLTKLSIMHNLNPY